MLFAQTPTQLFRLEIAFIGILAALLAGCGAGEPPVGKMPPVLTLHQAAPDFRYTVLQGPSIKKQHVSAQSERLSRWRGKVIYLDFWASWCAPCVKSMPLLNQLWQELNAEGFEVLAVNLDERVDAAEKFLLAHPVQYSIIRALDSNIDARYKIMGLPTAYLIDRNGNIQQAYQGFNPVDMKQIRHDVKGLLGQSESGAVKLLSDNDQPE